jgi:hypothetical protein
MSCGFCAGQTKLTRTVPGAHALDFLRTGRAHLEDDVGDRPDVIDDFGAGGTVGSVGEARRLARPRLHRDAKPELDQLLGHLGHRGDALLARRGFARHPDQLRHVCVPLGA